MNATTNKPATSATNASLPLNVVANNAKAEAKAQAKEQRKQENAQRQKAKKVTAHLCKELAKAHNTFFAMIRTALEVADYEVNDYTNFTKDEQKAVASMLRLLCGICTERGLPTRQQVANALNKYVTYSHNGQAVRRIKKAKGVYIFENYEAYGFALIREAFTNYIAGREAKNIEALGSYFTANLEPIEEAQALEIIAQEEQEREQAKAKAEQEAQALKRDAERWRKAQAKADEQAKAEAQAKRAKQAEKRASK